MATTSGKTKASSPSTLGEKGDILQRIETFLEQKSMIFLTVCMALTALFGLLLFDGRLSFATDDGTYILNALAFLKNGSYPNFQGALYPFFLALIIKAFGMRILLLKTFSFIFILLHNYIFYRAFKGRVPYLILFGGLMTFSINAYILSYGSSTFSEAFFLLLQSLGFLTFFNLIDKLGEPASTLKTTLKYWLLYGLVLFLMSLAKNVAVFAIFGVLAYFILRKEWKYAALALVFFAVFKLPYEMAVRAKYGNIGGAQVSLLMQKDFHDASKGTVDVSDLSDRFYDNFGNYFTVHTFKILGMRGSGIPGMWTFDKMKELQPPLQMEASGLFALLFIILFGLGLWQAFKHNKFMFYTLFYVLTISFVTFLALHTFWNQDRLIVIYTPLIFMGFAYGGYQLIKSKNFIAKPMIPILMALILLVQLGNTLKSTSKNARQFKGYTKGDAFQGYPGAIANYLKAAEWSGQNVQDDMSIVCAKPVEAAVFGKGHSFVRLPEIKKEQENPDSIMAILKRKKIGYIMVDAFQGNLSQLVPFLQQKYPEKFQMLHKEGDEETSDLVKINY